MTRHETEIRKLAESPLGSSRFTSFIRRWEMNNEPLPPADERSDKYACFVYLINLLMVIFADLPMLVSGPLMGVTLKQKRRTTSMPMTTKTTISFQPSAHNGREGRPRRHAGKL